MMPTVRTIGIFSLALAASCAALLAAPPGAMAQADASVARTPAKTPAKVSAAAAALERPCTPETPPPAAKNPEPPLDVDALKQRLRDTKAIGFFTKLELQNQMNDLLQQFREHYQNGQKTSVATLRQPFNMLVLKLLALIQDRDPSLARTISESRDAIWSMLADPEKFKTIS
ncbi:MAG: hypothetical protein ACTS6J_18285 [Burkholderiales bacterium]